MTFGVSALLCIGLVGCGAGVGPGPTSGEVEVSVTRDYGRNPVAGPVLREIRSSDTVMSLLDEVADVRTAYGGRFVEAIDGIASNGGSRGGDWFFFVNGIEAEIGAAAFRLRSEDKVWWDYRNWGETMWVGAVTGSYPAPLRGADGGRSGAARLSCLTTETTCRLVRRALEDDGIALARRSGSTQRGQIRIVVGPIGDLEDRSADYRLDDGPPSSGVYARLGGAPDRAGAGRLEALDDRGQVTGRFGAGTGLVAAVREQGRPPVWLITGTDDRGVEGAATVLEPDLLRSTYAVVVPPGGGNPLSVPTSSDWAGT